MAEVAGARSDAHEQRSQNQAPTSERDAINIDTAVNGKNELHSIAADDSPLSQASTVATEQRDSKHPFETIMSECDGRAQPEPCWALPPHYTSAPRPWRTTLMRAGPVSGFLAMFVAIGSIAVSLGILVASDGAAVSGWSASPSIYLATCTAIANLAMRYACIQGVVIAWWVRARKGSTLARLHYDWRSGATLGGALAAGRRTGLLGLATIFSTLALIDGPLLQRSSSVVPSTLHEPVSLQVSMAQEIARGSTGFWIASEEMDYGTHVNTPFNKTMPGVDGTKVSNDIWTFTEDFMDEVATLYYSNAPLPGLVHGCVDKCLVTIRAPAVAVVECTPYSISVDYHEAMSLLAVQRDSTGAGPLNQQAFVTAAALDPTGQSHETINLLAGYSTTTDCAGTYHYTACTLQSAIGEYNITVAGNLSSIETLGTPRIVALANDTRTNGIVEGGGHASTLAGVMAIYSEPWQSQVTAYNDRGRVSWQTYNQQRLFQYEGDYSGDCPSFVDPLGDMIASLNKLMVYTGAAMARNDFAWLDARMDPGIAAQTNTTVEGTTVGDQNVFRTDYWWFLAAALVEITCICFVAPTYWGYWRLGRSMSFSPLEIAKAFEAPLLAGCHSNSTGRDLARAVGDMPVKYGSEGSDELAFVSPKPFRGRQDPSSPMFEKQISPVLTTTPFRQQQPAPTEHSSDRPPSAPIQNFASSIRSNKALRNTTEPYIAYGSTEDLYLLCSAPAAYTIPSRNASPPEPAPTTSDGEDLGVPDNADSIWFRPKAQGGLELDVTFHTWAQIVFLHMYLLTVRLRTFPAEHAKIWHQQLLDHFFYAAEDRMATWHNISARSVRNKYLKDLWQQWRGVILSYDEGLVKGDAVLAGAVWRNLFKARVETDVRDLGLVVAWLRKELKTLEGMSDEALAEVRVRFGDLGAPEVARALERKSGKMEKPFTQEELAEGSGKQGGKA
ncbi:Serine carboxypeptidase 3 [Saxophila tyrrhenica]|uniref:Serine carboxypeptidase 3 n=1 Tax=Saxophila tyrrhenica TaxID=1690608 RepID=A0AAV9PLF7_9PEZI|nr:Serine carboxypeptidase 3 [Saxophila tyrrhenica]